jgi:outer membrane protein assembly factor BamB
LAARPRFSVALLAAALLFRGAPAAPAAEPADWPCWRGPGGEGVWRGAELPARLGQEAVRVIWRAPAGGGYSGLAVAGRRVFTLDLLKAPERRERVLCLDRESGKPLWVHEYPVDYGDLDHANGPRATPAVGGGRVYTLGATGRLHALEESTGKPVFAVDLAERFGARPPIWGHSASPVLARGLLVIVAGGRPDGTVIALDPATGAERWRALSDRPGYSTPALVKRAGQDEIVVFTADGAAGLDPGSGKARWRFPWKTSEYDVSIVSPVLREDRVFISGYWDGSAAIRLEGSGPRALWQARAPACLMATPLERDGILYVLDKRDGLQALEWESGNVLWKDQNRLTPSAGRNPHASPVWAGDRLLALNSEGELVLYRVSREGFEDLGRARIIGPTWAHPAFSGQEVFARSDEEVVCARVDPGPRP